jgi:kynurenine formamidase
MRPALLLLIVVALVALVAVVGCAPDSPPVWERELVDLTYAFDADTIYWPTETGFEMTTRFAGKTDKGYYYEAHSVATPEHGGTHMDAPIHFFAGRDTVDTVPLDRLIGPGVVVDVTDPCATDRDYRVGTADFERWEAEHGPIKARTILLLRTGFGRFWPDRERYMGTDERGEAAVAKLHFPGLDPDAVDWLAARQIAAIGLDTPSIDHGPSTHFEAHVSLFEKNIPAFENVANLDRLPATGFTVIALPMKIRGGSGGPLRIVAVLD